MPNLPPSLSLPPPLPSLLHTHTHTHTHAHTRTHTHTHTSVVRGVKTLRKRQSSETTGGQSSVGSGRSQGRLWGQPGGSAVVSNTPLHASWGLNRKCQHKTGLQGNIFSLYTIVYLLQLSIIIRLLFSHYTESFHLNSLSGGRAYGIEVKTWK